MVRPRLNGRNNAALFLCLYTVIPIVSLYGQGKLQVAPPAKTDSYGEDDYGRKIRIQNREVARTNYQIDGVDLAARGDFFTRVFGVLGKFNTVASGDASTALEEACYRSAEENDNTYLIFGEGEVDRSFILTSDSSVWKWKIPCKRSLKISRNLATASGLHLGQTQEQVIAILGLPTRHNRNVKNGLDDLVYELEAKKKMSSRDLAPYLQDELKQYPNLNQKTWIENNGYYSLWVSIHAKFINDALANLKILWSETY
jgi:hypothetical protein